jgi:glycosyltransferase involved in cell wall biosynthesis
VISIVVPVYNEEKTILVFLDRIKSTLSKIAHDYEIIFSLDPSTDNTEFIIKTEADKDARIKMLLFSRRVGQPMATIAGLNYSSGEAVIVIDCDLQDPPELIVEMIQKWKTGFDVVYAQRKTTRGETLAKRIVSFIGYKVINRISEVHIPINTGDFRLMSRKVVNEINKLKECHGFLRGLVALVGFKQTAILYNRDPRLAGVGKYNRFLGSIKIGFNGLFCFSNYMLTVSTKFGFIIAFSAFILAIVYLCLKLSGASFPMGNPTIVIIVLFLGGVQLMSVGILGEYISRIYDEVRSRPKYIVDKTLGLNAK